MADNDLVMNGVSGATPTGSGLSPSVEPVPVSPADAASIPSAGGVRHLKVVDDAASLCGIPYAFPHYFTDRADEATCAACLAVERAEAAQLNLYHQAERDRSLRQRAEESFDLIAPFVAKFAAAAAHYDGGTPRYPGSIFMHEPEPSYRPCLTSTALPPCGVPPSPTIGDLRMLATAFASAMSARSAETGTGSVRQDASAVGASRDAQTPGDNR